MFADLPPVSHVCKQPSHDALSEALKHIQSTIVDNTCKQHDQYIPLINQTASLLKLQIAVASDGCQPEAGPKSTSKTSLGNTKLIFVNVG